MQMYRGTRLTRSGAASYRMCVITDNDKGPGRAGQAPDPGAAAIPPTELFRIQMLRAATALPADRPLAARRALAAYRIARDMGDSWREAMARDMIYASIPKYHAQVATDPVRLAAWEAALAAVIRPGDHVLEVGVGCGILAMLACRSGAGQVTGCDRDPLMIAIAEEVIAQNGLSDRIALVAKPVDELALPADLDRPADLLMLDLFADSLFAMRPFSRVREALPLLMPDVVVVPRRAELRGALAYSPQRRRTRPEQAAGFDMTALIPAAPLSERFEGTLCGASDTFVDAAIPGAMPEDRGEAVVTLTSDGGPVNGVAVWIRLELAEGHVIDADPRSDQRAHANPRYYALDGEWQTFPGERITIRMRWQGSLMAIERIPD